MGDGLKLGQIAGVVVAGMAAFVGGVYYMVATALQSQPETPPLVPFTQVEPPNVGVFKPEPPAEAPVAPPAANPNDTLRPVAAPKKAAVPDLGWTVKTIWGLPSPRKLTAKEKAGLAMLGTAEDTHGYEFNSVTIEDGSRIPGTPALSSKETKEHVLGPIKSLGLADGFEAAVIDLAPHSLHHLSVQVSNTPDWIDVQAVLGKPEGQSEGDVYLKPPTGRGSSYFRVAWFRYGWLEFGVAEAKVRVIKANMRYAEIVPAESIPGGRSAPDPAKATLTKKPKPHRSPTEPAAEVDVLKLLGHAVSVKANILRSPRKDPQQDALVRNAEKLEGRAIYPGAIEQARQAKESHKIQSLTITTSQNPTIEQIIDLLGDPIRTKPDASNASLKWHIYFWLEFGVESGKVVKVKINCLMTPSSGL
jgi:hypothetical protein